MEKVQDRIIAYLIKRAKEIEYGEGWTVAFKIHKGEIVGMDEIKPPIVKIR